MIFRPIPSHEKLRPYIRNYWQLRAFSTSDGYQRVMSNGAMSLYFFPLSPMRFANADRFFTSCLVSHDFGCLDLVTPKGPFEVFGVEFMPFGARKFFDFPMSKCTGLQLALSDLNDPGSLELEDRILDSFAIDDAAEILDAFFLSRLEHINVSDLNMHRMQAVFGELLSSPVTSGEDQYSTVRMAETACLGVKQLSRVFSEFVGLSPKTYLRIMRFHSAMLALSEASHGETLSDVAWQNGYYDLPHMTSEFRQLCGQAPSELLKDRAALTETFNQSFSSMMKKKIVVHNLM